MPASIYSRREAIQRRRLQFNAPQIPNPVSQPPGQIGAGITGLADVARQHFNRLNDRQEERQRLDATNLANERISELWATHRHDPTTFKAASEKALAEVVATLPEKHKAGVNAYFSDKIVRNWSNATIEGLNRGLEEETRLFNQTVSDGLSNVSSLIKEGNLADANELVRQISEQADQFAEDNIYYDKGHAERDKTRMVDRLQAETVVQGAEAYYQRGLQLNSTKDLNEYIDNIVEGGELTDGASDIALPMLSRKLQTLGALVDSQRREEREEADELMGDVVDSRDRFQSAILDGTITDDEYASLVDKMSRIAILDPSRSAQLETYSQELEGFREAAPLIPGLREQFRAGNRPRINDVLRTTSDLSPTGVAALQSIFQREGWISGRLESERQDSVNALGTAFLSGVRNYPNPQASLETNSAQLNEIRRWNPALAWQIENDAANYAAIEGTAYGIENLLSTPGGSERARSALLDSYPTLSNDQFSLLVDKTGRAISLSEGEETRTARDIAADSLFEADKAVRDASARGNTEAATSALQRAKDAAASASDWDPDLRRNMNDRIEYLEGETEAITWSNRLTAAQGDEAAQVKVFDDFLKGEFTDTTRLATLRAIQRVSPFVARLDSFKAMLASTEATKRLDEIQDNWGNMGYDHTDAYNGAEQWIDRLESVDKAAAETLRTRHHNYVQALPLVHKYFTTYLNQGVDEAEKLRSHWSLRGNIGNATMDVVKEATANAREIISSNAGIAQREYQRALVKLQSLTGLPGQEQAYAEALSEAERHLNKWGIYDASAAGVEEAQLEAVKGENGFMLAAIEEYRENGKEAGDEFLRQHPPGSEWEGVVINHSIHQRTAQVTDPDSEIAQTRVNREVDSGLIQMEQMLKDLSEDMRTASPGGFDIMQFFGDPDYMELAEHIKEIAPGRAREVQKFLDGIAVRESARDAVIGLHEAHRKDGTEGVHEYMRGKPEQGLSGEALEYFRSEYDLYSTGYGMTHRYDQQVAHNTAKNRIESIATVAKADKEGTSRWQEEIEGFQAELQFAVAAGDLTTRQAEQYLVEAETQAVGWETANEYIHSSPTPTTEQANEVASRFESSGDRPLQLAGAHIREHAKLLEQRDKQLMSEAERDAKQVINDVLTGSVPVDVARQILDNSHLVNPELRANVVSAVEAAELISVNPREARNAALTAGNTRLQKHLRKGLASLDTAIANDPAAAAIRYIDPDVLAQYGYRPDAIQRIGTGLAQARLMASAQKPDVNAIQQRLNSVFGEVTTTALALQSATRSMFGDDDVGVLPAGVLIEFQHMYRYGQQDVMRSLVTNIARTGEASKPIFEALATGGSPEAVSLSYAGDAFVKGDIQRGELLMHAYRVSLDPPSGSITQVGWEDAVRREGVLKHVVNPKQRSDVFNLSYWVGVATENETAIHKSGDRADADRIINAVQVVMGPQYSRRQTDNWIDMPEGITPDELDEIFGFFYASSEPIAAALPDLLGNNEFYNLDRQTAADMIVDGNTYWSHLGDNKYLVYQYADTDDVSAPETLMVQTKDGQRPFVLDLNVVFQKQ